MSGRAFPARIAAKAAGALLALAAACMGTGAYAQDVPQGLTPLSVDLDNNGVNLVTGKGTIPMPTLSVPGAPNLKFDRVQNVIARVKG
ncbi:MAG TPA: hypothetical protein VK472_00340, partial [Allosphingosinicella sp.]|nr:hypothetical protein [Allosphingosinicella sp.]